MSAENSDLAVMLPAATSTPRRLDAGGGDEGLRHMELTPTPRRRNSNASEKSCNSGKSGNPILVYDSGNYSTSSNASDVGGILEQELQSHHERFQYMLREKDQTLFLALQDVRRLRSELERLGKSEQWYKQELRAQKSTRLEALERLYAQERKYMQENQRLQRECVRLYERCAEMEKELETQRQKALQQLAKEQQQQQQHVLQGGETAERNTFELEQQCALVDEQQQLIEVLRKQKRALLADLQRLTTEKDEKVLELQQTMVSLELENTRMTTQCKKLLHERQSLEQTLRQTDSSLQAENAEKQQLQRIVSELREQLDMQQKMLALKESEIGDLQQQYKANMQQETNMDEVHRLSLTYHEELSAKTAEIISQKKALHALQQELDALAELQTQKEQQERVIEQLNFTLEARQYELVNLRQTDAQKAQQLAELQLHLERLRTERETAVAQLQDTQRMLKGVEKELIALHEQYASMCALCERTRFELEMRQIEQGKLQFRAESDEREIAQLREKLREYLRQTEEMSGRMNQLEVELAHAREEKRILHLKVETAERLCRAENERCKGAEKIQLQLGEQCQEQEDNYEQPQGEFASKDKPRESSKQGEQEQLEVNRSYYSLEIKKLRETLQENEEIIAQLNEENAKLRQQKVGDKVQVLELHRKEEKRGWLVGAKADSLEEMYLGVGVEVEDELKTDNTKPRQLEKDCDKNIIVTLSSVPQTEDEESDEENRLRPWPKDASIELEDALLTASQIGDEESGFLEGEEEILTSLEAENIKLRPQSKDQSNELNDALLADVGSRFEISSSLAEIESQKAIEKLQNELREKHDLLEILKAENAQLKQQFRQSKVTRAECTRDVDLVELGAQQTKIIEQLNVQDALCNEKRALLDCFERLLDSDMAAQQVRAAAKVSVDVAQLVIENDNLKAQLLAATQNEANRQLQQQLLAKTRACQELADKLQAQSGALCELQRKLLENDAQLYKAQRAQQQMQDDAMEHAEQRVAFEALKSAHEKLSAEWQIAVVECEELTQALAQERETVKELQQQQQTIERADRATTVLTSLPSEDVQLKEVAGLRAKVHQLETQLRTTANSQEARKEQRIQLIKQLLEQQNHKVSQLSETQAEWEELLRALDATQKLEENTRLELQSKTAALEELNALFAEQNEELRQLHEYGLQAAHVSEAQLAQLKETFQQQLNALQSNLSEKHVECEAQQGIIAKLQRENASLQRKLVSAVSAECEVTETQPPTVAELQLERAHCAARMQQMEAELHELRQSKRQAMLLPESVCGNDNAAVNSAASTEKQSDENANCTHDFRLRILTKVLEAEHTRKMKRYDLHIRTLLNNVKGLKKALRAAEQRATQLSAEQRKAVEEEEARDLHAMRLNLEEMRLKFEQSQCTIKALEQALHIERKKFEASDLRKSVNPTHDDEPAHEVANLIDDYKKLIQQSAAHTRRPKTSTILDLIQRSNQCVPNLHKLESNINGLRGDVEHFLAKYAQNASNPCDEQLKMPSLMDELRAANEHC